MIRDNWMPIFVIALAVVIMLALPMLPAVSDNTTKPPGIMGAFVIPGDENSQFVLIGEESVLYGSSRTAYLVDRKTGVEYVLTHGGLTPRYHADGSLLIHPEYIMEGEYE